MRESNIGHSSLALPGMFRCVPRDMINYIFLSSVYLCIQLLNKLESHSPLTFYFRISISAQDMPVILEKYASSGIKATNACLCV